uniref:C2H2-type domain-containing protein n=3 Tax=Arion vulgaris TaxID=1028688 RepID=A0A0B7BP18_9EUPU
MAEITYDVKYDEELVKHIQELFINKIVPENFLLAVHKHDAKVLTMADIQRLRKRLDSKATTEVNFDLLYTMKNYEGWFEVILSICGDPDIKQEFLVEKFKKLKNQLDATWSQQRQPKKEESVLNFDQISSALNEVLEDDGAAGCAPPASSTPEGQLARRTSKGSLASITSEESLLTEDQAVPDQGWSMRNGTGRCYVCNVNLTSEKLKDSHVNGKNHLKKMRERELNRSSDETHTEIAPVATIEDDKCNMKNENECTICAVTFTSAQHAKQHLEGKPHKKMEAIIRLG